MIILEGCDNSGKSTLAKLLSDQLQIPIQLSTGPISDAGLADYVGNFTGECEIKVWDRTPLISEAIYRLVCRGQPVKLKWWLIAFLLRMKPVLVYCRPSEQRVMNWGLREQMDGVITNGPRLLKEYDRTFQAILTIFGYPVIYYDYDKHGPEQILGWVKHHIPTFARDFRIIQALTTADAKREQEGQ